jgi:exodeoxyribonuclease V alpha subunit
MGIVKSISDFDQELTVHFDDGRDAEYGYNELHELEHAFAITVHKSQGSEYPAVILPIISGNKKLLNRNLLYTAITRAKSMVVIVGNIGLVNQMIDNVDEQKRFTSLKLRLCEMPGEG